MPRWRPLSGRQRIKKSSGTRPVYQPTWFLDAPWLPLGSSVRPTDKTERVNKGLARILMNIRRFSLKRSNLKRTRKAKKIGSWQSIGVFKNRATSTYWRATVDLDSLQSLNQLELIFQRKLLSLPV